MRDDTLFVIAQGPAGTPLCQAGDAEEFIGELISHPPTSPPPSILTASLTNQSLIFLPDFYDVQLPPPLDTVYYNSVSQGPDVQILLRPATGEPQNNVENWELCLGPDTTQRLHRLSVGVIGKPMTDTSQMYFAGCNTQPSGGLDVRTCTALGPWQDDQESFTAGPIPVPPQQLPSPPFLPNALYVVLEGSYVFSGLSAPTLNPIIHQAPNMECLGVVHLEPGGSQTPALTLDGTQALPFLDQVQVPIQLADGLVAVDPMFVSGVVNTTVASDVDNDGYGDEFDNCTYECNPSQANAGALGNDPPDTFGDACQCADTNLTGVIHGAGSEPGPWDLDLIRAHAAGADASPDVATLCSVIQGIECTMLDAVVLDMAIDSGGLSLPGIVPVCESAVPPVKACP
jgi:hypothetical protein